MIETGVLFDDIHSFRDLNLVLAPFTLVPAKPKLNYFEVPGRDGSIDASEATGRVTYSDREFSFTFTVFPQDPLTFEERQTVVSNALNGKKFKITLDKDPDYYLIGRCTVKEYFANKKLRQIVVSCRTEPFKMKHQETMVTAFLESGEYEKKIILHNGQKPVLVQFRLNGAGTFCFGDGTYIGTYSSDGVYWVHSTDFRLKPGENTIIFSSGFPATIDFRYREGDL